MRTQLAFPWGSPGTIKRSPPPRQARRVPRDNLPPELARPTIKAPSQMPIPFPEPERRK